jgi:hypothetical protein
MKYALLLGCVSSQLDDYCLLLIYHRLSRKSWFVELGGQQRPEEDKRSKGESVQGPVKNENRSYPVH